MFLFQLCIINKHLHPSLMHIYIYIRSQNKIFYAHTFFVAPNNSSHPFELMVILAVSNTLVSWRHTFLFQVSVAHTKTIHHPKPSSRQKNKVTLFFPNIGIEISVYTNVLKLKSTLPHTHTHTHTHAHTLTHTYTPAEHISPIWRPNNQQKQAWWWIYPWQSSNLSLCCWK